MHTGPWTVAAACLAACDPVMAAAERTIEIAVRLPWQGGDEPDVGQVRDELRLLWIIEQVRRRHFGVGRGAELAVMPRAAFMRLLGEHGVPVIDYPPEELDREVKLLQGR